MMDGMVPRIHRPRRYLLTGIFTVIPIWITYLVFQFILGELSRVGRPWVRALSRLLQQPFPDLAQWILHPWFEYAMATLLTLLGLYLLGWLASRVIGRRVLAAVDRIMARIPLAQNIYGSTRKLLAALQEKPEQVQRVVLIEFPSPDMKTVGLVTRTLRDADSGELLAAVYVPTTPNPTSGYLEIVPVSRLTPTDWTVDEAMSFIISGGAVAPEQVHFARPPAEPPAPPRAP